MKRMSIMILVAALGMFLAVSPAFAQDSDAEFALVYLGAAEEEAGAEPGESTSMASELEYEHVVYAVEAELYLEGDMEEVSDLDGNDVTDDFSSFAEDADTVDELVENDEVTDATEALAELLQ